MSTAAFDPLRILKVLTGQGVKFVVNKETHHRDRPVKVGELQIWDVVNDTLARTAEELHRNPSFKYTVRVAMVTFGLDGVVLWRGNRMVGLEDDPFVDAADWNPPLLRAGGVTPLAEAVTLAVRCVEDEKHRLREHRRHASRYRGYGESPPESHRR